MPVSPHLRRRLAVMCNDPESLAELIALLDAEGSSGGVPFGPGTLGTVVINADDAAYQGGDYVDLTITSGLFPTTLTGVPGVPIVIRAQGTVTINGTSTITVAEQINEALRQENGQQLPQLFGSTGTSGAGGGGGGGGVDGSPGGPGADGFAAEWYGYQNMTTGAGGVGGSGGGGPGGDGGDGNPSTPGLILPAFERSVGLYPGGLAGNVYGGVPGTTLGGDPFGGSGGDANPNEGGGSLPGGAGGAPGVPGSGGGVIIIIAPTIIIGPGVVLDARGGQGGPGGAGVNGMAGPNPGENGSGGGGGGNGGGGGCGGGVFLFYDTLTNAGTVHVAGGSGGPGGVPGVGGVGNAGGDDGGDGGSGAIGPDGSAGLFIAMALQ